MQPRVTAIVVARNGEAWLGAALAALAGQRRRADEVVLVDARSADGTARALARAAERAGYGAVVAARSADFGGAVRGAAAALPPTSTAEEWLWLLSADTVPEPEALRSLLGAAEIAPSVAIAGPKLVDPEDRALLLSYGETLSRYGTTVPLVEQELDQGQHDRSDDVLGVAAPGMLIRRAAWDRLGGFDPGLRNADAGLDLSVRARLAGHRVVRVAGARVALAHAPEDFGRAQPLGVGGRARVARRAQLHRRLAYAPAAAVPLHWLSLLPLALLRALGRLLAKRPELVGSELAAAVLAIGDVTVPAARSRIRRSRKVAWPALVPLRMPADELRERRATARERHTLGALPDPEFVRPSFVSQGGIAVVAAALAIGIVLGWRWLTVTELGGGALLPLSDLSTLWGRLAWGVRDAASGATGPADPAAAVLAVLGSLAWWKPSVALVVLWVAAPPLAALGAWWCATRLSERPGVVAAVALGWAVAPPLLVALADGRPLAVVAHLLLPWLVLAAIEAVRSWSAAAAGSLLLAAIVACSPALAPLAVVAVAAWAVARPRALVRIVGMLVPAAVLAAPLMAFRLGGGGLRGLLADPGPAVAAGAPEPWQLLLGLPAGDAAGWGGLLAPVGVSGALALALQLALVVPLALLAVLAAFLPGSGRAVGLLALSALGLATAVAVTHVVVSADGLAPVTPWPGAALSVYWLGLLGAAAIGVTRLRRAAAPLATLLAVCAVIAAAPLGVAAATGGAVVPGRSALPALVAADGAAHPSQAALVLTGLPDGSLGARLIRGGGETLDGASSIAATARLDTGSVERELLVELSGNLASPSGYDAQPALDALGIRYVVVPQGTDLAARVATALDGQPALARVGESGAGAMWEADVDPAPLPGDPRPRWYPWWLVALALVAGVALLLAIPTGRGRRRAVPYGAVSLPGDDPGGGFDEVEDDDD